MILKTIKSHTIKLCAAALLGLASGTSLATVHIIDDSNFTILDPGGFPIPDPAYDVFGSFDDSMLCDDVSCTLSDGMTLASNTPSLFFGPWTAHHIRVFTEGTYIFDTFCTGADIEAGITNCGGGTPLTLIVGPGQLGMHGLIDYDWLGSDIDMAVVWNQYDTFPLTGTQIWNLASVDGDGDGVPGIAMVDGPFAFLGFNVNFNLDMDPPFSTGVSVTINTIGGTTQECTETGGATVTLTTDISLFGDAELASIDWIVDGENSGSGVSVTPFLTLGSHTVEAVATTTAGDTDTDAVIVNVVDTIPPSVDVGFLDSRTGELISEVSGSRMHFVTTAFSATDVCDLTPQTQGVVTPVFAVSDGDIIKIQGNNQRVDLPTSDLELSVIANDASGNTASGQAILIIVD